MQPLWCLGGCQSTGALLQSVVDEFAPLMRTIPLKQFKNDPSSGFVTGDISLRDLAAHSGSGMWVPETPAG
jgi:hypothetical protein